MFNHRLPLFLRTVLGVAVLGMTCAGQDVVPATETYPTLAEAPELAGLRERWVKAAADLGVPGYAVAVVKDGELYAVDCHGYGGNAGTHPIDPNTMFYIASITKTYTALGLAVLDDVGMVDLDAAVKTYLPRFELASPQAAKQITVRDLLGHKPGINQGTIVFLDAYVGQITEDRFYHYLAQVKPTFEVTYSNVHFTIAGRVIEAVTGQKWQDYLRDEIFVPTGMTRTTAYASLMYSDPNCAFPMIEDDTGWIESAQRKTDRVMHAAGGMGTTVLDGARWIEMHLSEGEVGGEPVVSPDVIDQMLEYNSELPRPDGSIRKIKGYGLGWFLGEFSGHRYAQHGGGYVGTAAHISFLPDDNIGIVVLANSSPGGSAFTAAASIDVYDRLLGEDGRRDLLPGYVTQCQEARAEQLMARSQSLAGSPVTAQSLGLDLHKCAGVFGHPHQGEITFQVVEDKLRAHWGDMQLRLVVSEAGPATCDVSSDAGFSYRFQFKREADGGVKTLRVDEFEFQRRRGEDRDR